MCMYRVAKIFAGENFVKVLRLAVCVCNCVHVSMCTFHVCFHVLGS